MTLRQPKLELWAWVVLLVGSGLWILFQLPDTADEFKRAASVLSLLLVTAGVLLFIRFRWAPEVFAGLVVLMLGWALIRMGIEGVSAPRIGVLFGALAALFGYPALRRQIREG